MNKRITKKTLRRQRMQRYQTEIFSELEKYFTLTNILYGDGYFVFTHGEHMVCHFSIKEIPGWRWGIWLKPDRGYHIFGEHEELIDKFKPSRGYLSYEDSVDEFIEELKKIQANPKLYFVDSLNFGRVLESTDDHQIDVETDWNEYWERERQRKEDELSDWHFVFNSLKNLFAESDWLQAIGVKDRNRRGFISSPRFVVDVVVPHDIGQEEIEKLNVQIKESIKAINFNPQKKTSAFSLTFDGFFGAISDIKDYHYKYYR